MGERLTEKYYAIKTQRCNGKTQQVQMFANVYNKLSQLEDIEEELGIDLITLFSILREKECFVKNSGVCYIMGFSLSGLILMPKAFPYGECEYHVPLKDYGRTWALTKEELQ